MWSLPHLFLDTFAVYGCFHIQTTPHNNMDRRAFLDQEPPPGYVAGVGRGATGFTTSADTARVKFESNFDNEEPEEQIGSEDEGILAKLRNRTNEDEEADQIYEEVERRLQKRKKSDEDAVSKVEDGVVELETGNGVIKQEFLLHKKQLATVSMAEWAALPEVGDITRKNKRQRLLDQQTQRTYAAPDALIAGAGNGISNNISLALYLALLSVDTSGVQLADIEKWEESNSQVGDVEKSRAILASLRRTEPQNVESWIALARLEEQAKNYGKARALIREGCARIPRNASIWHESIRIHKNSSEGTKLCKIILNEALRLNFDSESLWFAGVELENPADIVSRRKILMKALEYLPESTKLWKALVDMEDTDLDKLRLLERATELCSGDWDLWLNLINLSPYKEAKAVLNKARKALPAERKVWITALKLEERENSAVSAQKLSSMMSKGISELEKHSEKVPVDIWLAECAAAESEGFAKTCEALVENIGTLVSNDLGDLLRFAENSQGITSIHLYQQIVKVNSHHIDGWVRLFESLKQTKDEDLQLYEFYKKAIEMNPETEIFYLMYAKDKWLAAKDVPFARKILEDGNDRLPQSESIWLARVKLEVKNGNFQLAYEISEKALKQYHDPLARLWYKHIHLGRFCVHENLGFVDLEKLNLVSLQALDLFPENWKLYLQRSQILQDQGELKLARETLSVGTRKCAKSVEIWCALAQLDTKLGAAARARSLLDIALLENPESDQIWHEKIKLEIEQKDLGTAQQMVNKAMKLYPKSPKIWLQNLALITKLSHRKNAYLDALKQTGNSPEILLGIGVFFWVEGKFPKAKSWFDRAVSSDPQYGDALAWSFYFAQKNNLEKELSELVDKVKEEFDDIIKGECWNSVVKDPKNLGRQPAEILALVAQTLISQN